MGFPGYFGPFEKSQQIHPQDDGSIIFEAEVSGDRRDQVLGHDLEVKGLSPRAGIFEVGDQGRGGNDGRPVGNTHCGRIKPALRSDAR